MYSSFCGNDPVLKKWTEMEQNSLSNHISVVDNPILGPTQKKFGPTYEAHSSLQKPHKIENDMGKNTYIPQTVPKYLVSSLHPPWRFRRLLRWAPQAVPRSSLLPCCANAGPMGALRMRRGMRFFCATGARESHIQYMCNLFA
jgi:hypothetical protein